MRFLNLAPAISLSVAGLCSCFWGTIDTSIATAQIVPDRTLPQNSTVTRNNNTLTIEGGTTAGSNLFHSFREFSVLTGQSARFDNAASIQNIITRVTGDRISTIDGVLAANGTANLFLLNPNGIVFGENARLDIGGSFVGTTADAVKFPDGRAYSATNPEADRLLSINVPMGLQFGSHAGAITYRATGENPSGRFGVAVQPGNRIALLGSNLNIDGGEITAPQGQIHFAAIADSGLVRIFPESFEYRNIEQWGNIEITNGAKLKTSGIGGGSIQIRGSNVAVTNRAQLLARTLGHLPGQGITIDAQQFRLDNALVSTTTLGSGAGGDTIVRADDEISLSGRGISHLKELSDIIGESGFTLQLESSLLTATEGTGTAGDLLLETSRLQLSEGMYVSTGTEDAGKGGNIMIRASEEVEITDSFVVTNALRESTGNAGDFTLQTQNLSLRQGVLQTVTKGTGSAGHLTIDAAESVELRGSSTSVLGLTGIFATTVFENGPGGNIEVNTQRLSLRNGARIGNQTGARVAFGVVSEGGPGGNIILNASQIEIEGSSPNGTFKSTVSTTSRSNSAAGNIIINTENLTIREGGSVRASATNRGAAGFITINADNVFVRDGGSTFVNSRGLGNAGTLEINADKLRLNEGGELTAATVEGMGGNINLNTDSLALRRGSRINTDAENTDGGNIDIRADTIVALENSDITANALEGRGGRVTIVSQAIFGTQFRSQQTPESDITATSELGSQFEGTVSIDTPEIEPSAGLLDLDTKINRQPPVVASTCDRTSGSEFVISGRENLPPTPDELANNQASSWLDWRLDEENLEVAESSDMLKPSTTSQPETIVEARGWRKKKNGVVKLVAPARSNNTLTQANTSHSCSHDRSQQ